MRNVTGCRWLSRRVGQQGSRQPGSEFAVEIVPDVASMDVLVASDQCSVLI
jgi:hypothetical protein